MNKIFVISDLHLGHKNIIKICNRPFKSVEEMDNTIINNWNTTVSDNDIVYVLGDLAYKNVNEYLNKLNGKIILIKGNHDKYVKHPKIIKVCNYLEININKIDYVMCHYPISSWNGQFRNTIHLYGHIHQSSKNPWENINLPNSYNVNCEFHNYTPIEINNFKQIDFKQFI